MATSYKDIIKEINRALSSFDKSIPGLQGKLYDEMLDQVKKLDVVGDRIAVSVKNLSILAAIKGKLNKIILNKEYRGEIKDFVKVFNNVYSLNTLYWQGLEQKFSPKPLLKAVRNQAINDVVEGLTTRGISANVSDAIVSVLRTNITTGGSYKDLTEQLRQSLVNTPESKGILDKYVKTVATDSINQFNRQYTNIVAADLGYVWFLYANTEINTSRPFCQSMVENNKWFHISQVPELLQAKYLGNKMRYTDNIDEVEKTVELYKKTNLPSGFVAGTNVDSFFTLAGGYNCGHTIQPANIRQVPAEIVLQVQATAAYKKWEKDNTPTA